MMRMGQAVLEEQLKEKQLLTIYENYKSDGELSEQSLSFVKDYLTLAQTVKTNLLTYSLLIRYYLNRNQMEQAYTFFEKSRKIIPEQVEKELEPFLAFYFNTCGNYLFAKQDFAAADSYYAKAVGLELSGIELADVYYNLSLTKQRLLKDHTCIRYSKNAAQIYEEFDELFLKYQTYITIGVQYNQRDNPQAALEYLNEAREYMNRHNEHATLAQVYYNLGSTYQKLEEFEKAIDFYKKTKQLSSKMDGTLNDIYIYRNLSALYTEIKDFDKAAYYINLTSDKLKCNDRPNVKLQLVGTEAKLALLQGNIDLYESKMEKLVHDCKENHYYKLVDTFASQLGEYYYKNGNYKKASEILLIALESQKMQKK